MQRPRKEDARGVSTAPTAELLREMADIMPPLRTEGRLHPAVLDLAEHGAELEIAQREEVIEEAVAVREACSGQVQQILRDREPRQTPIAGALELAEGMTQEVELRPRIDLEKLGVEVTVVSTEAAQLRRQLNRIAVRLSRAKTAGIEEHRSVERRRDARRDRGANRAQIAVEHLTGRNGILEDERVITEARRGAVMVDRQGPEAGTSKPIAERTHVVPATDIEADDGVDGGERGSVGPTNEAVGRKIAEEELVALGWWCFVRQPDLLPLGPQMKRKCDLRGDRIAVREEM